MSTETIALALAALGAEIVPAPSGARYVSVPVGHNEAVEVDPGDNGEYYVTFRRWDRTGGVSAEEELGGPVQAPEAIRIAQREVARIQAEQDKLEALLATEPAEEDQP